MEQDRNVGEKPTLNKTIHLFFKSMLKKKVMSESWTELLSYCHEKVLFFFLGTFLTISFSDCKEEGKY